MKKSLLSLLYELAEDPVAVLPEWPRYYDAVFRLFGDPLRGIEVIQNPYDGRKYNTVTYRLAIRKQVPLSEARKLLADFISYLISETGFAKDLSNEVGVTISNSPESPFFLAVHLKDGAECVAKKLGAKTTPDGFGGYIVEVSLPKSVVEELFNEVLATGKVRKTFSRLAGELKKAIRECR